MFGRNPKVKALKSCFEEFRSQPVLERKNYFQSIQAVLKDITSKVDDVKLHQSCLSLIESCEHMMKYPPPSWLDEATEVKFVEDKIAEISRRIKRA